MGIFLCLVVGFRPRFHSIWSRPPPCNCLVKKINQGTDVLTHNCLPPLLALRVLKHICTRLIILTSSHKIKIDMASWQSAFTPSTANTFLSFPKMLIALSACMVIYIYIYIYIYREIDIYIYVYIYIYIYIGR